MKYYILFLVFFSMNVLHAQTMKWTYLLKDVSFGQTTAKDVDGDGKFELIFSTYWNDSNVYCLNAENGSLRWKHSLPGPGGGCNDASPLVFDPFHNANYKVVIPGSCMDTTFCLDADSGYVQWKTITGGGDSPPSCEDVNHDGIPEVFHGTFSGNVKCLNGQSGLTNWTQAIDLNAAIESEPTLIRNGTGFDFVVATWDFTLSNNKIVCYDALTHAFKWKYSTNNLLYHGGATGDLFKNGKQEIVIGDYDGYLYCLDATNGALLWKDSTSKLSGGYIGAAVTLADVNNDGYLDIIYMDGSKVRVVNRNDSAIWTYTPPSDFTNFRGAAVADVNHDQYKDITFATNYGKLISLDGLTGNVIRSFDLRQYARDSLGIASTTIFEVDNAPIIADVDKDGVLDVVIIAGRGRSDSTTYQDYGYVFCLSWGIGNGPEWLMFRHDEHRTACLCDSTGKPLSTTDIHLEANPPLSIFPNPALTTCSITNNIALQCIQVLDQTGKVIFEIKNNMPQLKSNLAIGSLTNGMYIIKGLDSEGRVWYGKLLKE